MKKNFLTKLQLNSTKYNFGYDYFRGLIKENNILVFDDLINLVSRSDYDNSNFTILRLLDYNITFFRVGYGKGDMYIGSIIFQNQSIPILCFEVFNQKQKEFTKSWGGFVLYGAYFRLIAIGYIERKKEGLYAYILGLIKDLKITRVDFRFDFFYNNEKQKIFLPSAITKLRSNSKLDYKTIGSKVTGWRLGDRINKRYLIRAYDKLLDTEKKGKFSLYADYFEYNNVYRLEFEFLNSFTKKFKGGQLKELQEYIEKFLNLDKTIGSIFETYEKIDLNDIQNRFKYADTTRGYLKGCIKSGINVFGLLQEALEGCGKDRQEIEKIFCEYLERTKMSENFVVEYKKLWYNLK